MNLFNLFLEETPATTTTAEETKAIIDTRSALDRIFDFDFGLSSQLQALVNKALQVLAVFVALIILCKIVDLITKIIRKRMLKKNRDKTITSVVYTLLNKGIKVILIFTAVGLLGFDTSSILALFTATGLGIGLALQGSLSNFAGGILIIIIRPFKLDDFIECQGVSGTVEEIHLFYTHLRTPDNKLIYVPNGPIVSGNVTNYSVKDVRRIDFVFTIDYSENFVNAQKLIKDIAVAHALVLKDPEVTVRISELANSAINLNLRVWVKSEDYWTVKFDLTEQIFMALQANNIKIPYPQLEVSYRNKEDNK